MNTAPIEAVAVHDPGTPSAAARARILSGYGEPFLLAGWRRVLMIHLEVEPNILQRHVPYPLDLYNGRAFVTLVSFTMEGMKPRLGGPLTALLFKPIATHDFLNVRTYVTVNGKPGIHFLAEWLNSRLAVTLGPRTFGLPYRLGRLRYDFHGMSMRGQVTDCRSGNSLQFEAALDGADDFAPAATGSMTEWLMERYTAFNAALGVKRFFRVWHPPWPQCAASISVTDKTLLTDTWPWLRDATVKGANYSPGFTEVWMGRPHRVEI